MARSLRHIRPEGTHKERSETRIVQTLQVCTTAELQLTETSSTSADDDGVTETFRSLT